MVPSLAGILVCAALLALGRWLRAPLVVALFAALPFGSTAIASVPALGGSTPLIYTVFLLTLIASTALRRGFVERLARLFADHGAARIVAALIVYAIASAILFPRLLAGETTALVTTPEVGLRELPLAPVPGNVTQTGYFVANALAFFALAIRLQERGSVEALRRGFTAWAVLVAVLGALDLAGKLAGAGDLLAPIRTTGYANLVETEVADFWRIAGGFSEASAFGGTALAALAFCYAYWRASGELPMLALALVLLLLLCFSTSSTAYGGLAIVAAFAVASIAAEAARGRVRRPDLVLVAMLWLAATAALGVLIVDEHAFDPLVELFDTAVLHKLTSASVEARSYWNLRSMDAFLDSRGIGIGLGSSRAASWPVAVLSQLGVAGALLMAALVGVLLHDMVAAKPATADRQTLALAAGARSAALAALAGACLASGSADPGLLFFSALAVVVVYRQWPAAAARDHPALRHRTAD